MALSAQERHRWRELEQQLTAGNSRTPAPPNNREFTRHTVAIVGSTLALVVVLATIIAVVLAVIVKILVLGVLGFVLMILGRTHFLSPTREDHNNKAITPQPGTSSNER